jgi:hypothetical protein
LITPGVRRLARPGSRRHPRCGHRGRSRSARCRTTDYRRRRSRSGRRPHRSRSIRLITLSGYVRGTEFPLISFRRAVPRPVVDPGLRFQYVAAARFIALELVP